MNKRFYSCLSIYRYRYNDKSKFNYRWLLALGLVVLGWGSAVPVLGLTLGPGEIEKVNWESRQLSVGDFNADGLSDMAYINGVERSIDLLIQKKTPSLQPSSAKESTPPSTLTRYQRERIPTEASASDFIFGDFTGSGQLQLAYTAKRLGIVFLQRNSSGRWVESHRIGDIDILPFNHLMWVGPLRSGDTPSLLVLVKGRLLVIKNYKVVASYGTLRDESGYLTLGDINSDGALDVIYDYQVPHGLAYRLQSPDGRFDSETVLTFAAESEKNFGQRGDRFYFFGGNTSFVEERQLVSSSLRPLVSIYGTLADSAAGTLADIDNTQRDSLILADSKGSQLLVYRPKNKDNDKIKVNDNDKDNKNNDDNSQSPSSLAWSAPSSFPSLKSVSAVLPLGGTSGVSLALFSPEERAIGVSSWADSRLSFPALVPLADEPVALFGLDRRAWAITRAGTDFYLQEIFPDSTFGERQKLEGLKRAPDTAIALRQKDGILLCFFQSRDAASFFWLPAKGPVSPVKVSPALMRSNFTGIDANRIGRATLRADSTQESLIISGRSTLRLYGFQAGQLSIADEVLSLNSSNALTLPFYYRSQLWAYDAKDSTWYQFANDKSSDNTPGQNENQKYARLWRNVGQVDAPSLTPTLVIPTPQGIIGVGRRAFYTLDNSRPGAALQSVTRWESGLKIDGYNYASLEFFDKDKKTPAAILFNQKERLLEIVELGTQPSQKPRSLLNFQVYQPDMHFQGRTGEDVEPREIVVADVTGDGRPDLILLIHNKILIYPQK